MREEEVRPRVEAMNRRLDALYQDLREGMAETHCAVLRMEGRLMEQGRLDPREWARKHCRFQDEPKP